MHRLVIRDVVLHDGTGSEPVSDGVLLTQDGRITYAGPSSAAPELAGAEVVEGDGRHLIPGLIDCHVHLCLSAGADFMEEAACSEEDAVERGIANLRASLAAGITTVRDLGGVEGASIRLARLREKGEVPGPRVLTAGRVLTIRGGHAHVIGQEADTPEELVAAVGALHEEGATVVKIVATGGVLTKGVDAQSAKYPVEALRAAADAAHASNLRIAAHAIGEEGIVAALRAGVDSVEHGCYLSDEAIALLTGGSQWLVATLSAPTNILRGGDAVPGYARAKAEEVGAAHRASFARAAAAGARVAAGTDAGTPFNPHGGIAGELRLMHENGLGLDRLLASATSDAAALLGIPDIGLLREGFVADAVLLDGDPLASVSAYESVHAVVQAGHIV